MSGKNRILKERWLKREMNLQQDLGYWKKIKDSKKLNSQIIVDFKKDKFNCKFNEFKNKKYSNNSVLAQRIKSYAERIFRLHAPEYGITEETEVTSDMIIELVTRYLNAPKYSQYYFCRDPSRQSFDEGIQIKMLEEELEDYNIEKLPNGKLTVTGGLISNDKNDIPLDQTSRSIDVQIISPKNNFFYGFVKYSNPIGSVTSSLQPGEGFSFLNECIEYIKNPINPKNHFFFLQVDGTAGEKEIPKMLEHISDHDHIFAGNTTDIIKWILNKESQNLSKDI